MTDGKIVSNHRILKEENRCVCPYCGECDTFFIAEDTGQPQCTKCAYHLPSESEQNKENSSK